MYKNQKISMPSIKRTQTHNRHLKIYIVFNFPFFKINKRLVDSNLFYEEEETHKNVLWKLNKPNK